MDFYPDDGQEPRHATTKTSVIIEICTFGQLLDLMLLNYYILLTS